MCCYYGKLNIIIPQKTTMMNNLNYLSPEFLDNPYPILARFRSESPVIWDDQFQPSYNHGVGAWHIFGYEDIKTLLGSHDISSDIPINLEKYPQSAQNIISELSGFHQKTMLFSDPPKHTRLRSLFSQLSYAAIIEGMRPIIQDIVDKILDNLIEQKQIDFIQDFAEILSINVVTQFIGFDWQDDVRIKDWIADESAFISGDINISLESIYHSRNEFLNYIQDLINKRRENLTNDLLSQLIIKNESEGIRDEELQSIVWLLIIAGYQPIINILGNGVLALLQNPKILELLKENPSLINNAVEEILRYDPSTQFIHRIAKDDLEFQGNLIQAGHDIYLWVASANRDPAEFPNPDCFDITRDNNSHIGFGYGIHVCLGAPLARLAIQISLTTILERLPELHLSEVYQRRANPHERGLKSLPLIVS